jgi:glycogen(starch) synthase
MTASIVVNTYNRARSLERLLPSLDHLEGVRFEVVVVNGPSTDDTEAVLARYSDRLKIARCPTANLSRSRNIGIAAAAGDVVVFIDDDALPGDVEWLRNLVDVFERDGDARIGAAGGASIHRDTDWSEFSGGWTSNYAEQIFTDQDLPTDVDGSSASGSRRARSSADPVRWCRRTVGNNSAFRRAALVEIGGFDERFRYYLDEADVCLRLVRAGYEVVYLHNSPVRHYPATSPLGAPFIRDRRLIARSDTYYCLKNGADLWPRRLVETLRRAPHKHFVRELRNLVTEGRITGSDLWRLRGRWLQGLAEGLALGLFASRATRLTPATPPPLRAFPRSAADGRLSICLLSRRLPPDPHAGGIGRYTYDLARGLHQLGHRVTIITESEVVTRREGLGFEVVGVRPAAPVSGLTQTPILAQNLSYADAVLARLERLSAERGPFDVVHASNWGIDALGVAQRGAQPLALMLVTPLECVIAAEGWAVSLDLAANIELDQWLVEHATRVCAPSTGVLASYASRTGWSRRSIQTVPLGIVCQPPVDRETRARRRLLFVGRLERRKGIHVLLEVLPRLLERHPEWQCDLVGDTSVLAEPGVTFESRFREEHAGASWSERVAFHGAVSDQDVQAFYRDADLFVAPSLYESFGLIYQEAMQYGVPVVGCRVGGVPEVVSHDEEGLLVPAGDAAALEGALDRLMSDDETRRRMGARAETTVRGHGSHLALAGRMVVEYRAAIAAHPTARRSVTASAAIGAWPSVVDAGLGVLEAAPPTRGLGLAFRASAALAHGAHSEAAELIAAALGVSAHPEYFATAVEVALADGDTARALELAVRGFRATRDDSDVCLAFAAAIVQAGGPGSIVVEGWEAWRELRVSTWPARLFAAALTAIRTGRDLTAIVLLETSLEAALSDPVLNAQALYHLGSALKRQGRSRDARECFAQVVAGDGLALLPPPVRAALRFHLGELELHENRPAASIEQFEACLALNPGHGRARSLLAEAAAAADAA